MNNRLLILVAILFLASFYYQQNIGGTGLMMPYASAIWIAALLFIAVGVFRVHASDRILLPRYWYGLLALPLGVVVSVFFTESASPLEWMLRLGYLFGGLVFLFLLYQFRADRRTNDIILVLLAVAGMLHSLVGLIQLHGGSWWVGLFPNNPGVAWGIFQQSNLEATFAATGLLAALYLMTVPGFRAFPVFVRAVLVLAVVLSFAAVLATGSRTGLLSLIVGISLLLVARGGMLWRERIRMSLAGGALLAGLIAGFAVSSGMETIGEKLDREGYDGNIRLTYYQLSLELFAEKPLVGHGLGSFQALFQEKRMGFQEQHPETRLSGEQMVDHPHNEVLFWLVESGLLSVIGMLVFAVVTVQQLVSLGYRRGLAYLALLLPIGLHLMLGLPFYLSPIHWFAWLLLLYLVHRHFGIEVENRLTSAARKLLTAVVLVVCAAFAFLFGHTLLSLGDYAEYLKGGRVDHAKLERMRNNPVLQEVGTRHLLQDRLYRGILSGNKRSAATYIVWAEQRLRHVPDGAVMVDLALAYSYLGDRENARRVIDKAVAIYRRKQRLAEWKQRIEDGTAIDVFQEIVRPR